MLDSWWAVLGSNQWPLPCETRGMGLRINDMRADSPIATGICYHVVSRDITQCHDPTVPKLSQRQLSRPAAVNGPTAETDGVGVHIIFLGTFSPRRTARRYTSGFGLVYRPVDSDGPLIEHFVAGTLDYDGVPNCSVSFGHIGNERFAFDSLAPRPYGVVDLTPRLCCQGKQGAAKSEARGNTAWHGIPECRARATRARMKSYLVVCRQRRNGSTGGGSALALVGVALLRTLREPDSAYLRRDRRAS